MKLCYRLSLIILSVMPFHIAVPVIAAQSETSASLQISADEAGVQISWQGSVDQDINGFPTISGWPDTEIGGTRLPAQLITLALDHSLDIQPEIKALNSEPWLGTLPASEVPSMMMPDGAKRQPLIQTQPLNLPSSPIKVRGDSRIRGTRLVVIAVTPIFERDGQIHVATAFEVNIAGVRLLNDQETNRLTSRQDFATPLILSPQMQVQAGTIAPLTAFGLTWKITVTQAGIQQLSGAALIDAGFNPDQSPAQFHLWRNGETVALEERGTGDGRLDPVDQLRFYAPPPGDRWNRVDTYWLMLGATPGLRMTGRNVSPASAQLLTTGIERGVWRNNQLYDSTLPGPDGDHWYAADLRTGPGQSAATLNISLNPSLPAAAGSQVLTVSGVAYTSGQHNLSVMMGADSASAAWSGTGNWQQSFTLTDNTTSALLKLIPGSVPDGVEVDSVTWERPVSLNFSGQGAPFNGLSGTWRYRLANMPVNRTLYDISDPLRPVVLNLPPGETTEFEDGPAVRHYLLAGSGTLHNPTVVAHNPVDLLSPLNADVLYIAPAEFHAALSPLLSHRQSQGYTALTVDVQTIYDTWNYGQVSPEAIRSFLRHAAATWSRPPFAVTLVGDGTSDPLNYTDHNNTNFIPPYLAMVDPWLGETACETCYAQLDGDNPLDDPLPDLMLGRLPVKNVVELPILINKIISYETASDSGPWRARNIYVADNYRDANNRVDAAGDFATFSEASVALQPAGISVQRLYYDPSPSNPGDIWREPDAVTAHQKTLSLLSQGAGLVNYNGHSHHWQWASTDVSASPPYLLGLWDIDTLTNSGQPSVLLEMTCLTSAFQQPAHSGTVIDERLLLHPTGGAVAVWGSTGLGVAYGHDALQRGFYQALWNAPPMTASLGQLTLAGYLELFSNGACCQDTLRTFALLGDPLTPARVKPMVSSGDQHVYLPLILR